MAACIPKATYRRTTTTGFVVTELAVQWKRWGARVPLVDACGTWYPADAPTVVAIYGEFVGYSPVPEPSPVHGDVHAAATVAVSDAGEGGDGDTVMNLDGATGAPCSSARNFPDPPNARSWWRRQ